MPFFTMTGLERRAGQDRLSDDALLPGHDVAARVEPALAGGVRRAGDSRPPWMIVLARPHQLHGRAAVRRPWRSRRPRRRSRRSGWRGGRSCRRRSIVLMRHLARAASPAMRATTCWSTVWHLRRRSTSRTRRARAARRQFERLHAARGRGTGTRRPPRTTFAAPRERAGGIAVAPGALARRRGERAVRGAELVACRASRRGSRPTSRASASRPLRGRPEARRRRTATPDGTGTTCVTPLHLPSPAPRRTTSRWRRSAAAARSAP